MHYSCKLKTQAACKAISFKLINCLLCVNNFFYFTTQKDTFIPITIKFVAKFKKCSIAKLKT